MLHHCLHRHPLQCTLLDRNHPSGTRSQPRVVVVEGKGGVSSVKHLGIGELAEEDKPCMQFVPRKSQKGAIVDHQ
jgi:hypothetical protein